MLFSFLGCGFSNIQYIWLRKIILILAEKPCPRICPKRFSLILEQSRMENIKTRVNEKDRKTAHLLEALDPVAFQGAVRRKTS